MNTKLKRVLQALLVNNISWMLFKPVIFIADRVKASRENYINRNAQKINLELCNSLFAERKILNGIFRGLFYGDIAPEGSSIFAKLLGSFENEIAADIKLLLEKKYAHLVNIGSAEGYYAVGMAYFNPGLSVKAFDISEKAGKLCRKLAEYNHVADYITVEGRFSIEKLVGIEKNSKGLFFIDCEGCEGDVINEELVSTFPEFDYVVELHYHAVPSIFQRLAHLLGKTHSLKLVTAIPEHEKVMSYDFPQLKGLTYSQKMFILNERSEYTQWLIATVK